MNKNLYRLVFSAARKLAMAVACALSPPAWPQIIAYRNAPASQQPNVMRAPNGVPLVNIPTPGADGVSHSVLIQFDISALGAILNNSRTDTATVLGGYVPGNPWLATGSAGTILIEVLGSNPSQLRGYVEVAGPRAAVILANPAGIFVNGGGFLNAQAATLSTGTPVLNGGTLASFRVRGGSITIEGQGLDTGSADFTTILTRAMALNASLWAKDLRVALGVNDVSAASTGQAGPPGVTPAAPATATGPTPSFALDVAAVGGMYSRHIHLVGTEAGLGIRNAGTLGASAGDLVLQANGMLVNRGLIDATNSTGTATTHISAPTINNVGPGAMFGDNLHLEAQTLNNLAEQTATGVKGATIAARNSLHIGVRTLNNSDMGLDTPGNPSQGTTATPSVNILSLGDIRIGGSLDAAGRAQGAADLVDMANARLGVAGNASVTADRDHAIALSNDPTLASQTLWDSLKEFALPQAAGYATGAALSAYIAEAQVLYAAVKAETSAVSAANTADLVAIAKAKVDNNFYKDGANPASWTNGKPGDASLNLATHWEKHRAEFPNFSSANDYYRGASKFVTSPPPGTLIKTAPNGDVLLYNPATNTFGVRTADGLPKTMFKPDPAQHGYPTNLDFWNAK